MNEQGKHFWYDVIPMIGGWLFVICVLLGLGYVFFLVVIDGRSPKYNAEEAEKEYQIRKRPQPTPRDPDDSRFFDNVEEARNDFN
jgi:hypothetical protein